MTAYEYRVTTDDRTLSALGREGWRVTHVFTTGNYHSPNFLLEREIQDTPAPAPFAVRASHVKLALIDHWPRSVGMCRCGVGGGDWSTFALIGHVAEQVAAHLNTPHDADAGGHDE